MGVPGAFGEISGKSSSFEKLMAIAGQGKWRGITASLIKAHVRPMPSFFIVGPPRTGTTWLHEILSGHVILPSHSKETRFFDTHFERGLPWYLAHYPRRHDHRPVGEVAPTYFASAQARERLACTIPYAKVICIFRNPVDRVVSLYRLKRAYGLIPWSLEHAMQCDPELMESGRYATHFQGWQCALGPGQVLATLYDDLRDNTQNYMDRLADFLSVPRFAISPTQRLFVHASENMTHPRSYYRTRGAMIMVDWFRARRLNGVVSAVKRSPMCKLFLGGGAPFADLSLETTAKLYELFRPEVENLERMLNRDLSAWKSMNASLAATQAAS